MFLRVKKSGKYEYLQIARSFRRWGRTNQEVVASLGRLDRYREDGTLVDLGHSFITLHEKLKKEERARSRRGRKAYAPTKLSLTSKSK